MGVQKTYRVRVTKDYLVFCSGHFITYQGDTCERLHGHNYRVAIEVEDALDENHYVFDFVLLKNLAREVVEELDHRMLLPTKHVSIAIEDQGENWLAVHGSKRWSFPKDDCRLLPIENTTAELLASYIGERLIASLQARTIPVPRLVWVEVEECFGQSACVAITSDRS